MRRNVTELLPDEAIRERVVGFTCSLHFHPDHPEAVAFWENAVEAYKAFPCQGFDIHFVALWRDLPAVVERFQQRCEELGLPHSIGTFDERYLFRDRELLHPRMYETCPHGHREVVLLPDGTAFRCIGHALFDIEPLGNAIQKGWDILLPAPEACEVGVCTVCDRERPG